MTYPSTMIEEWALVDQRKTSLVWYNYTNDKPDDETLPGTFFLLLTSEDPMNPSQDFVIQMAEYAERQFVQWRDGKIEPVKEQIYWWTAIHVPDLCEELCP